MGNEISTIGGAIATAGTSIAAGVCMGQVEALNNAVVDTAKFTGETFMKTNVRHVGELAGVSIAAAATLGQCEAVNECVRRSAPACGQTLLETGNGILDGTPVVGHIKGGIHYACGDKEGGDQAMKSASRTAGVMGGGVAGALTGGPVGAVAGGVAAGAAMDGITTGVDSAVHGEYRPAGQVAAWTSAIENKNPDGLIGGIIGIAATPIGDALVGGATAAHTKPKVLTATASHTKPKAPERWDAVEVQDACARAVHVHPPGVKMECAKIKVDGPTGWNVNTTGPVPLSLNIKGHDNLANFNAAVQKVSKIHPNSFKYCGAAAVEGIEQANKRRKTE